MSTDASHNKENDTDVFFDSHTKKSIDHSAHTCNYHVGSNEANTNAGTTSFEEADLSIRIENSRMAKKHIEEAMNTVKRLQDIGKTAMEMGFSKDALLSPVPHGNHVRVAIDNDSPTAKSLFSTHEEDDLDHSLMSNLSIDDDDDINREMYTTAIIAPNEVEMLDEDSSNEGAVIISILREQVDEKDALIEQLYLQIDGEKETMAQLQFKNQELMSSHKLMTDENEAKWSTLEQMDEKEKLIQQLYHEISVEKEMRLKIENRELVTKNQQIIENIEDIEQLRQQVHDEKERVKELQLKNQELEQVNFQNKCSDQVLVEQLNLQVDDKIQQLGQLRDQENESIRLLQMDNQRAKEFIEQLNKELDEKNELVEQLNLQVDSKTQQLVHLRGEENECIRLLQIDNQTANELIEQLHREKNELAEQLNLQADSKTRQIEELRNKENESARLFQMDNQRANEQIEQLNQEMNEKNELIEQLHQQVNEKAKQCDKKTESTRLLQKDNRRAKEMIEQLNQEISEKTQRLAQFVDQENKRMQSAQISTEQTEKIEKLNEEISEKYELIEQLNLQVDDKTQQLVQLGDLEMDYRHTEELVDPLRHKIKELTQQLQLQEETYNQLQIENEKWIAKSRQIDEKNEFIDQLFQQIDEEREVSNQLQLENERLIKQKSSVLGDSEQELAGDPLSLSQLKDTCLQEKEEQLEILTGQVKELESKLLTSLSLATVDEGMDELKEALMHAKQENEKLSVLNDQLINWDGSSRKIKYLQVIKNENTELKSQVQKLASKLATSLSVRKQPGLSTKRPDSKLFQQVFTENKRLKEELVQLRAQVQSKASTVAISSSSLEREKSENPKKNKSSSSRRRRMTLLPSDERAFIDISNKPKAAVESHVNSLSLKKNAGPSLLKKPTSRRNSQHQFPDSVSELRKPPRRRTLLPSDRPQVMMSPSS